jgi:FKBP-type peptidyl-prolyl cis-trans isomerase SlyD
MIIENRTVVSLKYRLTVDENGNEIEIEQTNPADPFVFLFGSGSLLPTFEKNLAGKSMGEGFDFRLTAEEGYGLSDEKNIVAVPMDSFKDREGRIDHQLLIVGRALSMRDQDGQSFHGVIKEVGDETVTVDFNHPLADKELHFVGEVLNVRLATLEELQHGHAHGPGGHHHH